MKTPEQIIKENYWDDEKGYEVHPEEIATIQKEAWNEALDKAKEDILVFAAERGYSSTSYTFANIKKVIELIEGCKFN